MRMRPALIAALVLAVTVLGAPPTPGALPGAAGPPAKGYLGGKLLVASPSLRSRVFSRTVIFLFRHAKDGAAGIILNRPIEKRPLRELMRNFAVDADTAVPEREVTVHFGGPVERGLGVVLHSREFSTRNSLPVNRYAALTSPREVLRALAAGKGPREMVFAVGYAGWGPGQLERELAENSWVVASPDRDFLFDKSYSTMWRRALDRRYLDL